MTGDEFPKSRSGRLIELGKIAGALSAIFVLVSVVWGMTFGPLREAYVMIGDFVDRFARLEVTVAELQQDVARANGEDRVIRQIQGQSYIREPVKQGDNVVMHMVAGRTKLGIDCRLTDWTPIFTDELNIPTPGQRLNAGRVPRQLSDDTTTLRIEMIPPAILRPGRIMVYLTLTYQCPTEDGTTTVQDRTDTLAYQLLPVG